MSRQITYFKVVILAILLAFSGCQSKQKLEYAEFQEFEKQYEKIEEKNDQLGEQVQQILLDLPKLAEVVSVLERSGISYQADLTNDLSNAENYIARNEKVALNLGVYSSDIAYMAVFNRIPECLSYLDQTRDLADKINVTSAFDLIMIERFEDNLGNKKRLAVVVDDFILQTSDILRTQYRANTSVLVITGVYIEGLYLSAGVLKNYFKDPNLYRHHNQTLEEIMNMMLEQKKNIVTLNHLLSLLEQDELTKNLRGDLSQLAEIFEKIESKEQLSDMEVEEIFHDPDLINMVAHVFHIRQSITG
jgi:hypothetical protein